MEITEIKQKAEKYLNSEENKHFADEIIQLLKDENWDELTERFYTDLSFGTGGLRGTIGGGTNRMNPFVIKRTTQGLANYMKKAETSPSAVIAYDSRNYSDLFALEAALTFCSNGIKTYLFSELRPTPELSYAVRKLNTTAGIVVTASHNPAAYNGYKVYWKDGGQIVPPHDNGIISEVRSVENVPATINKEEAIAKGLLIMIDEEIDKPYLKMVESLSVRPQLLQERGKELKIAFTPLHGTGSTMVPKILTTMGIEVNMVPEQAKPDGNFPTVKSPNPEEASALKMVLDLGKEIKADLVMGTDPDADRIGIAVPEGDGFTLINGNQLGALLTDYIFRSRKELNTLPAKPAFINTIVTSDLQRIIAESYGAKHYQTLTGFKYIGEKIREFEEKNDGTEFIFGGEESYGYLTGTAVRDKDAVSSAMLTAEMALYNISKGRTIQDHLNIIYQEFGYFQEILLTHTFEGQKGLAMRSEMMKQFRENSPKLLGGLRVSKLKDFLTGETTENGKTEKNIDLPSSDVLQFILEDGSIVTVRPSGTEPKIKFYASCRGTKGTALANAKVQVKKKIEAIEKNIKEMIENNIK